MTDSIAENNNELSEKITGPAPEQLLQELSQDIANEFKLDLQNTKRLLNSEVAKKISSLRHEIETNSIYEELSHEDKEKLIHSINGAREIIKNQTKIEIHSFKETVEKETYTQEITNFDIESIKTFPEKILPATLVQSAKNGDKLHEQLLGVALGTANSIYTTVEACYLLSKGLITLPYHLYLIYKKDAYPENIKNI